MSSFWIEYQKEKFRSPLTFWLHKAVDESLPWSQQTDYDPPLPNVVGGKGYRVYYVEYKGFVFEFASLDEIRHCIEILGAKLMPSTIELSERGMGPNSHWLSRLPKKVKGPWEVRKKTVLYLARALSVFEVDLS